MNQTEKTALMESQTKSLQVKEFYDINRIIKNYMQNKSLKAKSPVLSISSDQEKGLLLKWNFKGISTPNFQHYHVFFFVARDLKQTRAFFSAYCSNLRLGQIIGICMHKEEMGERKTRITWNEKSGCSSTIADIKKINLIQQLNPVLIQEISQSLINKRGIIVFNIFCDPEFSSRKKISSIEENVRQAICNIRKRGKQFDKIVFNLISQDTSLSHINSNLGLNFMHYEPMAIQICCEDLISYLETISIKNITLTIQTKQKFSIASLSSNQWFVTDAMEMQKKYFAFPKAQFCEQIKLYEAYNSKKLKLNLNIKISFTFFDDTETVDKKIYQFESMLNKQLVKSMNATTEMQPLTQFEFKKGHFFKTNLLKQQSHFVLTHIREPFKKKKK